MSINNGKYSAGPSRVYTENLIKYDMTAYDYGLVSEFIDENGANLDVYFDIIHQAEWKFSFTPAREVGDFFVSATCRRRGAYLQGFTVNFGVQPGGHAVIVVAWFVQMVATLDAPTIDSVLELGAGAIANLPATNEILPDDEIPF